MFMTDVMTKGHSELQYEKFYAEAAELSKLTDEEFKNIIQELLTDNHKLFDHSHHSGDRA